MAYKPQAGAQMASPNVIPMADIMLVLLIIFMVVTPLDRKSTRLNSSHSQISYAVFCLKKKKHRKARLSAARDLVPVRRSCGSCGRCGHRGIAAVRACADAARASDSYMIVCM